MHDIWNPWHGCKKCSEGCAHCYMFFLDAVHGRADSGTVVRTDGFSYPLSKTRGGAFKVKSGEQLRVCMTSDFFIEDADKWRDEAWDIIHARPDVLFFLLTKRPERVEACLPHDWGGGWHNVFFNVTCENQRRADERIPILHALPFAHKGIMTAPLLGEISIARYLAEGQIEQVICGGENYDGARPCHYEWIERLHDECVAADVTFCPIATGTVFVKDGVTTTQPDKTRQSRLAFALGLRHRGKPIAWTPRDHFGLPIPPDALYRPHFRTGCLHCGSRLICNGCSDCGKCGEPLATQDALDRADRLPPIV